MAGLILDIIELWFLVVILILFIRRKPIVNTPTQQQLPSRKIISTPHGAFTIQEKRDPIAHTDEELWEREHGLRD